MYSSKNLNTAVYLLSECEQFYDSDENAVKVFNLCIEYLYTKKVSKLKKAAKLYHAVTGFPVTVEEE